MSPALPFTGERFTPECAGGIWYEHWHRYALAAELAVGLEVLDAACGEGYGSAHLATVARRVTGVDVSGAAIAHARERYARGNLEFVESSVTRLPLADASVDLVVSFETIEHLEEQATMLAEFRRVLRPAGLLLISAPNRPVYSDGQNFRNEFHVREHDREELDALLAAQFPSRRWLGQRLLFQSVSWPLDSAPGEVRFMQMGADQQYAEGPAAPMYFMVAASADADRLPDFSGTSLFSDPAQGVLKQYESLMAWQWEARDQLHKLSVQLAEAQRLQGEAAAASGLLAEAREALEAENRRLAAQLAVLEPANTQFAAALETANGKLVQLAAQREEFAAQLAFRNSLMGWLRWPFYRLRRLFGS